MEEASERYIQSLTRSGTIEPAVADAITWMMKLQSGEASDEDRASFSQWYHADPANAAAWTRLKGSLDPLKVVADDRMLPKGAMARRILKRDTSRRRFFRTAAIGAAGTLAVAATTRFVPFSEFFADHTTWTGQRTEVTLAHGGTLVLAPRSAVNIVNDQKQDHVELLVGEVLLTLPAGRRDPLHLTMGDWSIASTSGRVAAHYRDTYVSASAIDQPMNVAIAHAAPRTVAAGWTVSLDDGRLREEPADTAMETAWTGGLLVVRDRPLSDVVRAMRPYYLGIFRVSPAAAKLRVGGVYRLNEPLQTFNAIAETIPILVREVTPFWINLDVKTA